MGFLKKTWVDRISEYPARRRLKKSDGTEEVVTVSREEGTISKEGDSFSAQNMNDLETRVSDAFDEVNNSLANIKLIDRVFDEGDITSAFTGLLLCSINLKAGKYIIIAHVESTNVAKTSAYINVNDGITSFVTEEFTGGGGFFMQTNVPVVVDFKTDKTLYLDIQTEASSGNWIGAFNCMQIG